MEQQKQIADWREEIQETNKAYLKIADGETVEFTFVDEGKKVSSADYGISILFQVAVGQEVMDWYVNANNFDLLKQIKELGNLKGMLVAVSRVGSKKSDTRYTIKKI